MKAIAMRCNEQQFESIKPKLEEAKGVYVRDIDSFETHLYLTTNLCNNLGIVSNVLQISKNHYSRKIYEEWDETIFLDALDIVDDELPEKWCVKGGKELVQFVLELEDMLGKTINISGEYDDAYYYIPETRNFWRFTRDTPKERSIITIEQLRKHYLKNKMEPHKNDQKLKVHVTEVVKLHKIACPTWKTTFSHYLKRLDEEQNITFTQTEVDAMFKAATIRQKPVLEEVFGKRTKPIEWDKIKTGSKVMIIETSRHCNGISKIDTSRPVDVIFYKKTYLINPDNHFQQNCYYPSYCTFHQDGNFVVFSAHTNVDYITEVIEY